LIHTGAVEAEIYVNGLHRGTSPLLLEGVRAGPVRIEAKGRGMYGRRILELQALQLVRVDIEMNRQMGRIFVKASDPTAIVRIDGVERGFVRDGLFSEVPEGERHLEVIGRGLYAETTVSVLPNQTQTVAPVLVPVGAIRYSIPGGGSALIQRGETQLRVVGQGWLQRVEAGSYTVETTHPDYQTETQTIRVLPGRTTLLEPALLPSPETIVREAARREQEEREAAQSRLISLQQEREFLSTRRRKLRRGSRILYGVSGAFLLGSGATLIADRTGPDPGRLLPISGGLGVAGALGAVVATVLVLEQPDLDELDEAIRQARQKTREF
jgi:hypothetical protein